MNGGTQLEDGQERSTRGCAAYGEEWGLFDLLTCQQDTLPKQKLRTLKITSAIDIGCGDTRLLHSLYHMLGIQKCVGVDCMDELEAIKRLNKVCKKDKEPHHQYTSFYDNYIRGYDPRGEHIEERIAHGAFKEHISYVEHDLRRGDLPDERYGLVIMSNVLHYLSMERCEALIGWARRSVDAGGWLYLRFKQNAQAQQLIQTSTDFSYEDVKAICHEAFPKGFVDREDPPFLRPDKTNEGMEFVWTNLPL